MFAKQYIRTLLAAVALFLGTLAAEAQSRSVTGTVFNDDGKTPLVGCTIIVQGTPIGTTTEALVRAFIGENPHWRKFCLKP